MTAFHSANMMLDYQDIGSGPLTLVLLPGWCEPKPCSSRSLLWRPNVIG